MYSEESLEMIPRYTAKVPYFGAAIRRQEAEYNRKHRQQFDFNRAFWTPPLAPRQAYRLEEKQIQRQFQLPALVSLTDHDDIRAGSLLRVLDRFKSVPISTEWTIPFRSTFFHLGVHNIPSSEAASIMEEFKAYTGAPQTDKLAALLEVLNSFPEVLLVLNHPLWDEKGIGLANHAQVLGALLERFGARFHALELNGLRSWAENKQVIRLGREVGLPVVSGGDRHGREPNAILNLTRASTFAEFALEVRHERLSHVVFMPQYHEPIKLRILQTMVDVVRNYPENFEGRRSWGDRVFFRDPSRPNPLPLSEIWNDDSPMVVKCFVAAMRVLEWRGVRSALRIALDDRGKVWQTTLGARAGGVRRFDADRELAV